MLLFNFIATIRNIGRPDWYEVIDKKREVKVHCTLDDLLSEMEKFTNEVAEEYGYAPSRIKLIVEVL